MKPRGIDLSTHELLPPRLVGVMVLLDRSGSMKTIRQPMEDGFAQFLTDNRAANPDGMWLTLHQFDTEGYGDLSYEVTYDRTPLRDVGALNLKPRGWTPLRDALCRFALDARRVIDDPLDPTEKLLLVIITDGDENRSTKHSWDDVRELMSGLESTDCETVWLGTTAALLEAQNEMPAFAAPGGAISYTADEVGVKYASAGLSRASLSMRVGSSARAATADYTSSKGGDNDAALEALIEKMKKDSK